MSVFSNPFLSGKFRSHPCTAFSAAAPLCEVIGVHVRHLEGTDSAGRLNYDPGTSHDAFDSRNSQSEEGTADVETAML